MAEVGEIVSVKGAMEHCPPYAPVEFIQFDEVPVKAKL
jgi:hypothetical protein